MGGSRGFATRQGSSSVSGCAHGGDIAKLGDETRKCLMRELRQGGRSAKGLSPIGDILPHYKNDRLPNIPKGGAYAKRIRGNRNSALYATTECRFGKSPCYIPHEQYLSNGFSNEFPEAAKKGPPFMPPIAPKLREKP